MIAIRVLVVENDVVFDVLEDHLRDAHGYPRPPWPAGCAAISFVLPVGVISLTMDAAKPVATVCFKNSQRWTLRLIGHSTCDKLASMTMEDSGV